ncbi:hypothetical protein [Aneurinibacillus terranovensis]|uniref:hypothetical protein n=1 Tax=Aneurinibacillus terranovensis TaxID=278991 RepID=UPI00041809CF|nr:hypothetical protein [Aneurinibacillus terranovensis]
MTRSAISALYTIFLVAVTIGIPLLIFFGTDEPVAGLLAAVLSFIVLLSYMLYANLLNRRS